MNLTQPGPHEASIAFMVPPTSAMPGGTTFVIVATYIPSAGSADAGLATPIAAAAATVPAQHNNLNVVILVTSPKLPDPLATIGRSQHHCERRQNVQLNQE